MGIKKFFPGQQMTYIFGQNEKKTPKTLFLDPKRLQILQSLLQPRTRG